MHLISTTPKLNRHCLFIKRMRLSKLGETFCLKNQYKVGIPK